MEHESFIRTYVAASRVLQVERTFDRFYIEMRFIYSR